MLSELENFALPYMIMSFSDAALFKYTVGTVRSRAQRHVALDEEPGTGKNQNRPA
jgi:hypothetical protein